MEVSVNTRPTSTYRQRLPGRLRALFDLVKDRGDWRRPIDRTVDEPAAFAFMPPAKRESAREAFVRDLNEAIAHYTGERGTILARAGGDAVRFRVRARGYFAVRRSRSRKVGFLGRLFG